LRRTAIIVSVPQTHSGKLRLRIINFPERVWAQDARNTRAREHDLYGDHMAVGNSKQLHNQMPYGPANRLKLFRKACSTNLYNMVKNNLKSAAQAVLENHSKSGFRAVWYDNASKSPSVITVGHESYNKIPSFQPSNRPSDRYIPFYQYKNSRRSQASKYYIHNLDLKPMQATHSVPDSKNECKNKSAGTESGLGAWLAC
jgi:hypothetical protein